MTSATMTQGPRPPAGADVREVVDDAVRHLVRSVVTDLRRYYDEVDSTFAESLLLSAAAPRDADGYFTMRKRLFSLWQEGAPIAFTVATVKRGGSVKIGPTATHPAHRRRGAASLLRDAVEHLVFDEGARKLYMTISARNHPALEFNLRRGFRIEGVLGGQYRPGAAELVLGRFPDWQGIDLRTVVPEWASDRATALSSADVTPSPELLRSYLGPRMAGLYEGVDDSFFHAVAAACRDDRQSYARKGKQVLVSGNGGRVTGLAVYVPKRGGAAKLSPFFAESEVAARRVHEMVVARAEAESRRRIYVHVPVAMSHLVAVLHGLGYSVEALLREPYRVGVDVLSLGLELA